MHFLLNTYIFLEYKVLFINEEIKLNDNKGNVFKLANNLVCLKIKYTIDAYDKRLANKVF